MSILRIRDENGVVHDVYSLKGEKGDKGDKGDTGGSTDLEALKKIEAIQQELIDNGGDVVVVELPSVGDEGDVLTVEGGSWVSKSLPEGGGAVGGQEYFADVEDLAAGKKLSTDKSIVVEARTFVLNGAGFSSLEKDGMTYGMIGGIEVPDNDYKLCAVNRRYVDKAIEDALANAGGGGSSTPVNADWNASKGEDGYVENRTHCKNFEYVTWIKPCIFTTKDSKNNGINSLNVNFTAEDSGPIDDEMGYQPVDGSNIPLVDLGEHVTFNIDETYRIMYDGTPYYSDGFVARGTNASRNRAIGNGNLANTEASQLYAVGDGKSPFFIFNQQGESSSSDDLPLTIYTDTPGDHTISVERILTTYNTLDPNYIADEQRADKLPYVDLPITVDGVTKTYRLYGKLLQDE